MKRRKGPKNQPTLNEEHIHYLSHHESLKFTFSWPKTCGLNSTNYCPENVSSHEFECNMKLDESSRMASGEYYRCESSLAGRRCGETKDGGSRCNDEALPQHGAGHPMGAGGGPLPPKAQPAVCNRRRSGNPIRLGVRRNYSSRARFASEMTGHEPSHVNDINSMKAYLGN